MHQNAKCRRAAANVVAILAAIVLIALLIYSVVHAFRHADTAEGAVFSAKAATVQSLPTPVPSGYSNVYVRVTYDAKGNPSPVALRYAGDNKWDDCDGCMNALTLTATEGGLTFFGPAAEGKKGAAYTLQLNHKQVLKGATYTYRSLKTGRKALFAGHWNGRTPLLARRGGTYISEIFFKYFDTSVVMAPKGLPDPTLTPMDVGGTS
jgi:hypothetical protein